MLPDEPYADALYRLLLPQLAIAVAAGRALVQTDHAYSHFRVTLHAYTCKILRGKPMAIFYSEYKWVEPAELSAYAFPKVQHPLLEAVTAQRPA